MNCPSAGSLWLSFREAYGNKEESPSCGKGSLFSLGILLFPIAGFAVCPEYKFCRGISALKNNCSSSSSVFYIRGIFFGDGRAGGASGQENQKPHIRVTEDGFLVVVIRENGIGEIEPVRTNTGFLDFEVLDSRGI